MPRFGKVWLPQWLSGKESACSAGYAVDVCTIPGWGRSPEEEMATHSSNLAGTIPWIEEPGELQSMGLQRVGHDWAANTFRFILPQAYDTLTPWTLCSLLSGPISLSPFKLVVWSLLPGKPAFIPFPSLCWLCLVRHSCEQQYPPPSLSFSVTFLGTLPWLFYLYRASPLRF